MNKNHFERSIQLGERGEKGGLVRLGGRGEFGARAEAERSRESSVQLAGPVLLLSTPSEKHVVSASDFSPSFRKSQFHHTTQRQDNKGSTNKEKRAGPRADRLRRTMTAKKSPQTRNTHKNEGREARSRTDVCCRYGTSRLHLSTRDYHSPLMENVLRKTHAL